MTTFLLDLWQDLRAKRLWPIAVALGVALVAIPVVLVRPASNSAPAPVPHAVAGAKLPVVSLDQSSVDSSSLDAFGQKNPFKVGSDKTSTGTEPLGKAMSNAVSSANSSVTASAGGGVTSSAAGSTVSAGSSPVSSDSAPTGPDGSSVTPGLHFFTYTADVRFGLTGKAKSFKGVRELALLPDDKQPVISFYGVKDGKTAIFFVYDPTFSAHGEGTCRPEPTNCRFLYLKTDDKHNSETLTAQGGQVVYDLKLTGLHVKSLSEAQAVGDTTPAPSSASPPKKGSSKGSAKLRGASHERAPYTLLTVPRVGLARR